MPKNSIRLPLVSIFLVVALFNLISFQLRAENWFDNGLIRISEDAGILISGSPSYLVTPNADTPVSFRNLKPFDNDKEQSDIQSLFRKGSVWIKVEVFNPTSSDKKVILRLYEHCQDFSIYYNDGREFRHFDIGAIHRKRPLPDSYYDAAPLLLPPGYTTLYLHHISSLNKAPLSHIEIVHVRETVKDREESWLDTIYFNFTLYAFLFVILFQIIYIGIQAYYHKGIEYMNYLIYLILIGLYFQVRYEMMYHVHIVLYFLAPFTSLMNDMLLLLPYLFYLRFSRHFIGMEKNFPEQNRQIKIVEYAIAIMVVLLAFISWSFGSGYTGLAAFVFVLPLFIYTIWLFVFFYRRRNPIIKFFLLGSICAATGHFLALFLSVIPDIAIAINVSPIYLTMIGLVFEMFFFNTGLGYKAKYEQDEKLKLQLEYYRQVDETHKVHSTLQHMRNRIASDLHDDVGSTLSSIGIYSQLASQEIDQNPEVTKDILEKIKKASHRMMEAMSDIVWAIHSRNDDGIDLFSRMRQFGLEHLSLSGISFEMENDPGTMQLLFTMEARQNLMFMFKEIIHNAAKYSQGTAVKSTTFIQNEQFILNVKDNGTGFKIGTVKSGHGLLGFEMRTKSLGGNLTINSSESGTEVVISIPLDKITSGNIHYN